MSDTPSAAPHPTDAGPPPEASAEDGGAPAPTASPARPPARPGPTRLQRTTALIATLGVAVAVLGLLALLKPVSTPAVDCGSSLTVLLDGKPNQLFSEDDPPEGITPEEAKANNERPCRERVADVARPAVLAITVGTLVALVALVVEVTSRAAAWRRRVRTTRAPRSATPTSGPGSPPSA